jgi:hypothetical protein
MNLIEMEQAYSHRTNQSLIKVDVRYTSRIIKTLFFVEYHKVILRKAPALMSVLRRFIKLDNSYYSNMTNSLT